MKFGEDDLTISLIGIAWKIFVAGTSVSRYQVEIYLSLSKGQLMCWTNRGEYYEDKQAFVSQVSFSRTNVIAIARKPWVP